MLNWIKITTDDLFQVYSNKSDCKAVFFHVEFDSCKTTVVIQVITQNQNYYSTQLIIND